MKSVLLLCMLFVAGSSLFAQGKLTDEKRREFEAQKVAFFTQELDLTPSEAALFWPLYNEMRKKIEQIEGEMRKRNHSLRNSKKPTEEDFRKAVIQKLVDQQAVTTTKETYTRKMLEVLPPYKIWRIEFAECKFHRQLFDKLRRESTDKK